MRQLSLAKIIVCMSSILYLTALKAVDTQEDMSFDTQSTQITPLSYDDYAALIENPTVHLVYIPQSIKKVMQLLGQRYPEISEQDLSLLLDNKVTVAVYEDTQKEMLTLLNYVLSLQDKQSCLENESLHHIQNYIDSLTSGDATIALEDNEKNKITITCACLTHDIMRAKADSLAINKSNNVNVQYNWSCQENSCNKKESTGATGATGLRGSTGATGATGSRGNTGANGSTSPRGATGVRGSTGPRGNTGAQGTNGSGPLLLVWANTDSLPPSINYMKIGTDTPSNASVGDVQQIRIPKKCTAKDLWIRVSSAGANGITGTIRKNGVDSLLQLFLTGPSGINDTTTIDFEPGDVISLKIEAGRGARALNATVGVTLE